MTVQQTAHDMIDQLNDDGLSYIINIFRGLDDSKWRQPKVVLSETDGKINTKKKDAMRRIETRRKKYSGVEVISYDEALMESIKEKMTQKEVRNSIKDICDILTVVGASNDRISHAIDNEGFLDFEDALQAECAKTVDADYIVTGNIKDFKSSDIPAVTPDEFYEKIWVNVEF